MELSELRTNLGNIDKKIIELIAERQHLVVEIGRLKQADGLGTRNFVQEREVIERARAHADDVGVSPDVAEKLVLLLIETSLAAQEQDRVIAKGSGSGKRVLVIGGAGKIGHWMATFLASQGFSVETSDPVGAVEGFDDAGDWRTTTLDHDIIVVAAPLNITAEILDTLADAPPKGLIFDVGSLKSPLRAALKKLNASGARVASLHPMFGPDTELLSGRHVIFIDVGNAEAVTESKQLFASTMVVQVDMNLEEHDRLIAYVLGLSHALNIAFFTALAESGETAPKLAKMSSTTFNSQLQVASAVAEESPDLYFEIQKLNDYGTEGLTALLYAVERIRSVVRAGDAEGFRALMERGRSYLNTRSPRP